MVPPIRPSSAAVLSSVASPHSAMSPAPTRVTAAPTGVTVTLAPPLLPSLVAVIVVDPAATPLTSPLPLTVATAVLPLAHVTIRPESALPIASFGVAVSCWVCPGCRLTVAGLTVTDATGTLVTVIAAVPLLLSLVAVIVADPAATPLTSPLPLTVATAVLPLAHVTTRPESELPPASLGVAVSCWVCPGCRLTVAGLTVTDATGTLATVTAAAPLVLSLVPVTATLAARIDQRPTRDAPCHTDLGGVAGRREANRHEVLELVLLKRHDLGEDDELTDCTARTGRIGQPLAGDHRSSNQCGCGYHGARIGFEPGETLGQLVQERH